MYTQQQYQSVSLPQQKSTIQKLLDDNSQLISLILDLQSKGRQTECFEYQKTLHRNLTYLIQFDPLTSHHPNNLPPPDAFIQSPIMNGNIIQQTQSEQIYRTQTNNPVLSNTLNQTPHYTNTNLYPSSISTNSSISSHSNPINKPSISQQRSSYSQSYSIQQNGYAQYPMYHQ